MRPTQDETTAAAEADVERDVPAPDPEHGATDGPATTEETATDVRAHLAAVTDGCGCAEIWEHLSGERDA